VGAAQGKCEGGFKIFEGKSAVFTLDQQGTCGIMPSKTKRDDKRPWGRPLNLTLRYMEGGLDLAQGDC